MGKKFGHSIEKNTYNITLLIQKKDRYGTVPCSNNIISYRHSKLFIFAHTFKIKLIHFISKFNNYLFLFLVIWIIPYNTWLIKNVRCDLFSIEHFYENFYWTTKQFGSYIKIYFRNFEIVDLYDYLYLNLFKLYVEIYFSIFWNHRS